MKKILFLAIAMVTFSGYSQDSENPNDSSSSNSSFYIGVGAGLSFPGGDIYEDFLPGVELNFLNVGYKFNESWGITANFASAGNALDDDDIDATLGLARITVGPMYTSDLGSVKWEFKPQIALSVGGVSDSDLLGELEFTNGNGFVIGNSILFGESDGFQFTANIDYSFGNLTELEDVEIDDVSYSLLNLGVGVRYNF